MDITWCPSPNHGVRRGGQVPDMLLIHYTVMPDAAAVLRHLCNPVAEVSAHYLIDRDGAIAALVPEDRRAWHAGAGEWGGCGDVNSRSIGIELVNTGAEPFADPQMTALLRLVEATRLRWPAIAPERVLGHSDTAPGRKIDPGPRFDWSRMAAEGHALWAEGEAAAAPAAILAWGFCAGYTGCQDVATLVHALRLRFRPWALGKPLSRADAGIVRDLARRFPVDPGAKRA